MIKAFFLQQLIPYTKHINHVFSCFASRSQNLSSLYKFEAYISCNRLYIHPTYIYFITRVFFNYCCWQFPPHFAEAGAHQISLHTLASPPACSFTSTVDKFIAGVFCLFKSHPIRWPATCLMLSSPVCRARKCGLTQEGLAPSMSSLKYCSSDVLLKRCFSWRYAVKFPWFLAE